MSKLNRLTAAAASSLCAATHSLCHSLFFSPFCCILRGLNPSGGGGRNLKPPKINYYTNPFSQGLALQMYKSISFSLFYSQGIDEASSKDK